MGNKVKNTLLVLSSSLMASSIIFNILHTHMIPTITAKRAISGSDIVWYWLKYHHHWVIIMLFCQRNTDKESAIIKQGLMAKLAGHFREASHGGKGGHQHWSFTKIQPSGSTWAHLDRTSQSVIFLSISLQCIMHIPVALERHDDAKMCGWLRRSRECCRTVSLCLERFSCFYNVDQISRWELFVDNLWFLTNFTEDETVLQVTEGVQEQLGEKVPLEEMWPKSNFHIFVLPPLEQLFQRCIIWLWKKGAKSEFRIFCTKGEA